MMDQDDIDDQPLPTNENGVQDENSQLNMSDIIDAIQSTDPTIAESMFNNVNENMVAQQKEQQRQPQQPQQSQQILHLMTSPSSQQNTLHNHQQQQQSTSPSNNNNNNSNFQSQQPSSSRTILNNGNHDNHTNRNNSGSAPYVKITEQPASKALRFRYECEGRSAGSIPGVHWTPENKTFPSIQVCNYVGRAVVVVSCVTKDQPYKPHPHNLVGKDGCKRGVCTVEINRETMSVQFSNLGIQCVKKRDIEEALKQREEIRVDPYRTGFSHRSHPANIDLNCVRLCFQVFLEGEHRGKFSVPLKPVVSDPIFDKKAMSDLQICKLSDYSCSVAGGREMILLCEKVVKEDISVRFFEEVNDMLIWEAYGDFQHTNVHKQVAISFKTPRYRTLEVDHPVKCLIQLKRPSDGVTSEALPFEYTPLDSEPTCPTKRKRKNASETSILFNQLGGGHGMNITEPMIKDEPMDNALSPYPNHNIYTTSPSPQRNSLSPNIPYHILQTPTNPTTYNAQNFQNTTTPYTTFTQTTYDGQQNIFTMPSISDTRHVPVVQLPSICTMNVTGGSTFVVPNTSSTVSASIVTTQQMQQNIITTASTTTNNANETNSSSNLSSLFKLDEQQFAQINSSDLTGLSLSLLDGTYTNENQIIAPTPSNNNDDNGSENDPNMDYDNMTDSFTRCVIKELNDLNNSTY